MRTHLRSLLFSGAALVACAILASPGGAVERGDLEHCAAIANDAERLTCYDELSARVSSQPLPDPEQRLDREPECPEPEPREPEHRAPEVKHETPSEIVARITEIAQTGRRRLTFTLENGQIWRQADYAQLRLEEPETRRAVIKKSWAGAFWLKLEGGSKKIRVVRVK